MRLLAQLASAVPILLAVVGASRDFQMPDDGYVVDWWFVTVAILFVGVAVQMALLPVRVLLLPPAGLLVGAMIARAVGGWSEPQNVPWRWFWLLVGPLVIIVQCWLTIRWLRGMGRRQAV